MQLRRLLIRLVSLCTNKTINVEARYLWGRFRDLVLLITASIANQTRHFELVYAPSTISITST